MPDVAPTKVDRTIACDTCRRMAEGTPTVRVEREFRTAAVGNVGLTVWTVGLVLRVRTEPVNEGEGGEWGYAKHAYLVHPGARNTYALLCANQRRVGRMR